MSVRRAAILSSLALAGASMLLAWPDALGPRGELEAPVAQEPAATLTEATAEGMIDAAVILLPDLGYRLDILISPEPGAPPPRQGKPTVLLERPGMDSGGIEPFVDLIGVGAFRVEGTFAKPGRWRFRIGFQDRLHDLVLDVAMPDWTTPDRGSGAPRSSIGHLLDDLGGGWL